MSKARPIRLNDLLPLAWGAIRRNRLRSVLTIGAIAVGISSLTYLVSLGFGLEKLTLTSVEQSSTLLSITVKTPESKLNPLTAASVAKIRRIAGVDQVLPRLTLKGEVSLEGSRAPVTVVAVDPEYLKSSDRLPLSAGRLYRSDDADTMVVTTGFLGLFGLPPGRAPLVQFDVRLDGSDGAPLTSLKRVSAVGVVVSDAQAVYLPRTAVEAAIVPLLERVPPYEHAVVTTKSVEEIQPVRNTLISNGFQTEAAVDTVQDIRSAFAWIRGVLAGLGLIATLVATLGMFNTLTVSLLERTREIGIMKALGIRKGDVARLFMAEAALVGMLGGAAGLLMAFVLQQLTTTAFQVLAVIAQGSVPQLFDNRPALLGGALLFALAIALLTGIAPARRAAKLTPIDAIRHA